MAPDDLVTGDTQEEEPQSGKSAPDSPSDWSRATDDPRHAESVGTEPAAPNWAPLERPHIGLEMEISDGFVLLYLGQCKSVTPADIKANLAIARSGEASLIRLVAMGYATKHSTVVGDFYNITNSGHKTILERGFQLPS
jgi:hypothetical protein